MCQPGKVSQRWLWHVVARADDAQATLIRTYTANNNQCVCLNFSGFPDIFAGFLLDGFITFQPSNAEDKALRMLLSSGASQAELQVADPQFASNTKSL